MRKKLVMLVLGSMLVISLAGCGTSGTGNTVVNDEVVVENREPEVKEEEVVAEPTVTPAVTPAEEPVVEPTEEAPAEEVVEPTEEPVEETTSDGAFEESHYGITEEDWNQMEKDGVLDEVLDVFDPFRNESSSSSSGGYVYDPAEDVIADLSSVDTSWSTGAEVN